MKYCIPGAYYREENSLLINAWYKQRLKPEGDLSFVTWLKDNTGCSDVYGNWEDGWSLQFDNEATYVWFLLKWGSNA